MMTGVPPFMEITIWVDTRWTPGFWDDLTQLGIHVRNQYEEFNGEMIGIPSGKHTNNYGKSPSLTGKWTINGPCSIAMLVITRGKFMQCNQEHDLNMWSWKWGIGLHICRASNDGSHGDTKNTHHIGRSQATLVGRDKNQEHSEKTIWCLQWLRWKSMYLYIYRYV